MLELFALILEKGKLSPRSVSLFNECGHEVVTRVLRELNLRDVPVLVESTTHLWLGEQRRLS